MNFFVPVVLLLAATEAPKVATTGMQCEGIAPSECRTVEELILSAFSSDSRVGAVLSGGDLKALLDLEDQKKALDCNSESCLADIGRAVKVDYLVTMSLGRVGEATNLSLRMLRVDKAKVLLRLNRLVKNEQDLPKESTSLGKEAVEKFIAETGLQGTASKAASTESKVDGVAVFDLEAVHGVKPSMARVLNEIMLSRLGDSERFKQVVSGQDLRDMLSLEQQKQALGCEVESCMAELGGALGVPFMAVPTVSRLGNQFVLTLKMIDVEEAQVKARVSRMTQSEVQLPMAVQELTDQALQHLFIGAEVVKSRVAVRKFQRQIMRGSGLALMVGGAGALTYSIVALNDAQTVHNAQLTTVSLDGLLEAQEQAVWTRWGALSALTLGGGLYLRAPAEVP